MAFSDIAIKKASESAIFGLQRHMGAFKLFAHNFSPVAGTQYAGIQVPVYNLSAAADFVEGTNDYCSGADKVDGTVITLDKHFVKSIALPDTGIGVASGDYAGAANGEAELNFIQDGARAIADVLGTAASKYVFGMFNASNVALSATMPTTKAGFAGLMKVCDDNGVDPFDCALVLDPENYGALMGTLDANIYGGPEAIRAGVIENIYGFKGVVMTGYLPEGVKGVIVPRDSFGVVTRINKPTVDGYVNTWTAEDGNGIGIGFRVFEHLCYGKALLAGDMLVGAKILPTSKAIRLV